jgi:hypothetical protein
MCRGSTRPSRARKPRSFKSRYLRKDRSLRQLLQGLVYTRRNWRSLRSFDFQPFKAAANISAFISDTADLNPTNNA